MTENFRESGKGRYLAITMMTTSRVAFSWTPPPETWLLESEAVHVWCTTLDQGYSRIRMLERTLSSDERDRAARFHFQTDRERFIASRGILRSILGRYQNIEPGHVRFHYDACGKPTLDGESANGIRFNISHSAGVALYAVARSREVGIDLEWVRPSLATEQIAERLFSPLEVAALRNLSEERQAEAFFTYWTLKEAYSKAIGKGLAIPLEGFEVIPSSEEQVWNVTIRGQRQEACHWSLRTLSLGPGYCAALAVEGHGWQLQCFQWGPGVG